MSGVFDYSPRFNCTAAISGLVTSNGHGLQAGDPLQFMAAVFPTAVGGDLALDVTYFVSATTLTSASFKISRTPGGTVVDLTGTGTTVQWMSPNNRPLVGIENFPKDIIRAGRGEVGVSSYKAPPPANKLEAGYKYDTITGTLSGGGGESWS